MAETGRTKVGLKALLTPEESVLLLVDHQAFQFANLHSHEPQLVVNNVIALAKTARTFNVPTILTTVLEERGGYIIKGIHTRETVQAELDRFHYDTAQVSLGGTLAALAKLVPVSQIVYGSDFPYRTAAEHSKGVDAIF